MCVCEVWRVSRGAPAHVDEFSEEVVQLPTHGSTSLQVLVEECLMKPQISAVPFAETPLTSYRFVTITRLIINREHLKFHCTYVAMIEFK